MTASQRTRRGPADAPGAGPGTAPELADGQSDVLVAADRVVARVEGTAPVGVLGPRVSRKRLPVGRTGLRPVES